MAVAVILVPVVMVDAFVMEMPEGASFIDRNVGIALHDIDLIVLVFCHFRVIRVVMALFRDLFAAATAAAIMLMGVAFVVMVMPTGASVLMGVAFVVMVMPASAFVLVGVAFVVMVMPASAFVLMGVAFVVMVMTAGASVLVGVTFVAMVMAAGAFVLMGVAFVVVVMAVGAFVLMGVAFVAMVMAAGAVVIFFLFLVVCMLFGAMDGFLCLMAVAASAVMYMLFIVFFHGMSPYLEWKRCFLTGIILWCYFSILQRHRKWSMRNTLIFQVGGQG